MCKTMTQEKFLVVIENLEVSINLLDILAGKNRFWDTR